MKSNVHLFLLARLIVIGPFALLTGIGFAADDAGFKPIFDGKTLDGWRAPEMQYWSVEDGAITGRGSPERPVKENQYLVWQLGELDDFELQLKFRISGSNAANSGIQFRCRIDESGHAIGYQADIDRAGRYMGVLYDERGRGVMASRGRKTVFAPDGERTESVLGDPDALWRNINLDGWNEYRLHAVGGHITLQINGKTMAEVVDKQQGALDLSGQLALQLHSGPPLTVQFKDIRLKRLALEDRKKIVLVAGPLSHGYDSHAHGAGCRLLADRLNRSGLGVHAVVYENAWPRDPTAFDNADAVAIYSDGLGGHALQPDRFTEFDAVMRRGVGLACIHYAVIPPTAEQNALMLDWLGGVYDLHWSVNPFWTAEFKQLPKHPIAGGVKPFTIHDEWYYHMRFQEDMAGVTPILTATPPDETRRKPDGPHSGNPHVRARIGMPEHVAWAYQRPGGGRGFGFTGMHVHWNWAHDDFRKVILNALVWIAGADVPPEGVPSDTPTLEELEALLGRPAPEDWDRQKIRDLIASW